MQDEDLREQFSEWARPLRAAVPPAVSVIRRRARRRTARVMAACVTAVAVVAAGGFLANREIGGRQELSASPRLGTLPAPDAGPEAAPYYVAVSSDGGSAGVWDAATGRELAAIDAPTEPSGHGARYPTLFTSIAAAGDDRTFVLGATASTNSEKAFPVWLFEVRLAADGSPGPLQPLSFPRQQQGTVGHWYQSIASIALTADGTRLAIATNRVYRDQNGPADIEVITLATGATRTWTSAPQDIGSLSWAGESTLAYACDGVCLLDTTAPGRELSQSRLVIPWSTRYQGLQSLQWPMITPDGSAIYVAMEGSPGSLALVEFSARTGRPLRVVIQPENTDGAFCGTLWSDPSGRHLTAACTWGALTGTVDNGRFTPGRNLSPPTPGTDGGGGGGDLIAWLSARAAGCPSGRFRSSSEWTSRNGGSRELPPDGGAMVYTLSYQMYKYEHGVSAAEQRAADVRVGEAAAGLRDLRLCLGRAFRPRRRVRPARGAAGAVTGSGAALTRALSSGR
jgi:hypothetical protein